MSEKSHTAANSTITLHHFLRRIVNSHDDAHWREAFNTSLTSVIAPTHKHISCKFTRWQILARRHTDVTIPALACEVSGSNIFNKELVMLVYLCFWVDFLKPKTLCKNVALFAERCNVLYDVFKKHCPMFLTMFYKKQNIALTMLIAHHYWDMKRSLLCFWNSAFNWSDEFGCTFFDIYNFLMTPN